MIDYNDADQQQSFGLIPKGTPALIRLTIKPGGYDDPAQGWIGGWATQARDSGAVFLAGEFVVIDGEYAKRKVWSNIGLHSPKGATWGQMGRTFIRAALNSARGLQPADMTPATTAQRRIEGFHELDGLVFPVRIDVEKDERGDFKNVVKHVIEPDQAEYATLMQGAQGTHAVASAPAQQHLPARGVSGKPSWAQ